MGTKLLLGFGGTVNQAVVHHDVTEQREIRSFGGTVNQAVVHLQPIIKMSAFCFGSTVNQVVVHHVRVSPEEKKGSEGP